MPTLHHPALLFALEMAIACSAYSTLRNIKSGPLTLVRHTAPVEGWQLCLTGASEEDIDLLNEELPKHFAVMATSGNRSRQQWHLRGLAGVAA